MKTNTGINPQTWRKLKRVLTFALKNSRSSFYRDKYKPLGLDNPRMFKSDEDFLKIPLLTREELAKAPLPQKIFSDWREVGFIRATSGTSGRESLITPREKRYYDRTINRYSLLLNLLKKLRCAIVLLNPAMMIAHVFQMEKNLPLIIGNVHQMQEAALSAKTLNIDTVLSTPTIAVNFIKFLKLHYDPKKIKLFILIAEPLTQAQRKFLKKECPKSVLARNYGSSELQEMAFQCEYLARKKEPIYHANSDNLFFEIIPEKPGQSAGEIVLTNLHPQPSLFIRYRTGDLGIWIKKKCPCGLNNPLIKLLGRKTHDKVRIGGFEIHRTNFEKIIHAFPGYLEDDFEAHFYQHLKEGAIINEIIVKVMPRKNAAVDEITKAAIEREFNEKFRISNNFSFRELTAQNVFMPITVEIKNAPAGGYKAPLKKKLVPHF